MKAPAAKTSGTSLVLCFLTEDYQSRVIDGPRNKGETLHYKYGITATNFEWNLTEFRKDSPPIIRIHASRFEDLVPSFKTEAGCDPIESMKRCLAALEATAKLKVAIVVPKGKSVEEAISFAREIDSAYQTNYAIHDDVRERYFGAAEDDSDE